MTTPSILASVYNCTGFVNGSNSERLWSERNIFTAGASPAHIPRFSNEGHAGRAAWYHSDNGTSGDSINGFAGSNPAYHVDLFTSLRQVENMDDVAKKLSFYNTMTGADIYETPNEYAGKSGASCPVSMQGGYTSYTNAPSVQIGLNSDRKMYQAGLYAASQPRRCN